MADPPEISKPEKPVDIGDAAEILRPNLREPEAAESIARRLLAFSYRGPVPPPAMLAGYDQIVPGSAADIIDMATREQRHRHRMDWMETAYPYCGLALGALAFFACIGGAVALALHDKAPLLQGALVSVPVVGAIGWFINARITRAARSD